MLCHQDFVATCEEILRHTTVGGPKSHQQNKCVLYGGQQDRCVVLRLALRISASLSRNHCNRVKGDFTPVQLVA